MVKIWIKEVVIFYFVKQRFGEEEDDEKDDDHVVETSEVRLVQPRFRITLINQSGRTFVLFLDQVGRSDVGVIPRFILLFHLYLMN